MEKIKGTIDKIKEDSYIRILIELILGTMLFNTNQIVGVIFIVVLAIEIIKTKTENSLFIYLYLSFFDEVLQNQYLGGSVSRIIMIIISIKLIINIIKNKVKPNKKEMGIAVFFVFSFIVGIITYKTLKLEVLIILFNIFIFILFSMCIRIKQKEETDNFIEKILFTIVIAVLNSSIYGLITGAFLQEIDGESLVYRFKGTYEPNFMSMFINLGIISVLALKKKNVNKKILDLICSFFIVVNILTVSMTGLAILIGLICLYIIMNRKNFKEEIKNISIILIIAIMMFTATQIINKTIKLEKNVNIEVKEENTTELNYDNVLSDNINEEYQNAKVEITEEKEGEQKTNLKKRLEFVISNINEADFARVTSGRLPLMLTFINASFDRPLFNILFGNDAETKTLFSRYFYHEKYSHNSYADLLYNFGIIGFAIIIMYIIRITIKDIYLNETIKDNKYKSDIKLVRIVLMIYALSLSLYTKRMFLIFFLL